MSARPVRVPTAAETPVSVDDRPSRSRPWGRGLGDVYLRAHALLLVGYALAGKGFAYLGVAPVYVGELSLAFGVATVLLTGVALRVPLSRTLLLLLIFQLWCALHLVGDLPRYGVMAARDSSIWGYGIFAVAVAALLASRPERLAWLVKSYGRFGRLFLAAMPGIWIAYLALGDSMPRLPGTEVGILCPKSVDVMTHLAGIASFQLLGLAPTSLASLLVFWAGVGGLSVHTRGGMLAFLVAVGFVCAAQPLQRKVWIALGATAAVLPLVLSIDLGIRVRDREISGSQLARNVWSIFVDDASMPLESTRSWRMRWWSKIADYTFFGPYFWWGKGFGVNLAHDDGFDVDEELTLRSPHNGHLTVLARAGVPGAVLWILLQASWVARMAAAFRWSRLRGQRRWSRLYLFLIAYWLAYVVNSAFDVYLEGPMGGIWFWTLFGVGLGAVAAQRRRPWILEPVLAPPVAPPAPVASPR
jgi:hypothetical protein